VTKAHHELGKRNPSSCVFLFPTRADLDPLREEMGFVFQGTYFFWLDPRKPANNN